MKSLAKILFNTTITSILLTGLLCVSINAAQLPDTITVTSSVFDHHGTMPLEYSAYGDNKSPDISWGDLPDGTMQLALVLDDPIPGMPQPFVHWVAYNISPSASGIPADLSKEPLVAGVDGLDGMINGINGIRRAGYFGPRPPDEALHAYHFRIYALDAELNLAEGLNKVDLLAAIEGHVLGTGMLMGHFKKPQ